jgi:heme-degrading monooxygenase HmoA
MIVVVFQVTMREGRAQDYFDLAAELRAEAERIDGFISVERFESLSTPGKYLSVSCPGNGRRSSGLLQQYCMILPTCSW